MTTHPYQNFDLLITRTTGGYNARVINAPAGQAHIDFVLPFSQGEVRSFFWLSGALLRHLQPEGEESMPVLDPKAFGARLYDTVFAGTVGSVFRRSLDLAGGDLRIRLRLDDVPELADLPWEYLYATDLARHLALSQATPLVRYLQLAQPEPRLSIQLPLRILAVVANPTDVRPLAVEQEWQQLAEVVTALQSRHHLLLDRLEKATLPALQARLRKTEVHVLHFIGHGTFDAELNRGGLIFETEVGTHRLVDATDLATLLHDHQPLRLVFLNACQGAQGGRSDPFAGVAQKLVQQGVPSVLAMQFPVSDRAAITLAREFYSALDVGYPIDTALSEARKAIHLSGDGREWGTPVLFSRSPDNLLSANVNEEPNSEKVDEERILEAAIAHQVLLDQATELLVKIKLANSEGLRALLKIDPTYLPSFNDIKSKSFSMEFPLDDNRKPCSVSLDVRVDAPNFEPKVQSKQILISPYEDSELCTFLLTPRRIGELVINLEVYRSKHLAASRLIRVSGTAASKTFNLIPKFLAASIPFLITVQKISADNRQVSGGTAIHTDGGAVVQGNVTVGGDFVGRDHITVVVQRPEDAIPFQQQQQRLAALHDGTFARLPFEPETVLIPGGVFWMGSDTDAANEAPRHQVSLPDFRMGKYPVTNAQYAIFLKRTGYTAPAKPRWFLQEPPPGKAQHPVTGVSWYDAAAYCAWLAQETGRSYHLPSEAEWEKAAAWHDESKHALRYPWGEEWREGYCNVNGADMTPVDAYLNGTSPYGCYDMLGNVQEWTRTLWGSQRETSDYAYPYQIEDGREALKVAEHLARVYYIHRGGCYRDRSPEVHCSMRGVAGPESAVSWRGFRLMMKIV